MRTTIGRNSTKENTHMWNNTQTREVSTEQYFSTNTAFHTHAQMHKNPLSLLPAAALALGGELPVAADHLPEGWRQVVGGALQQFLQMQVLLVDAVVGNGWDPVYQ